MNNHHDFFKKCFCGSQLCVMCLALICIFLVVCIYNNFQSPKIIPPQADFRGDYDTVSKLFYSETEQKLKLPDKHDDVDKSKISSQKDSNQQKQDINQQKVVKHDKPGNVVENKPNQKDNNQQKANGKPDQLNVPGMNATHINGILMETVNVNYTRNIYFTVKTTYRFYTQRLFWIMLTWLQTVDKNKLSIISDKSASKQNYVDMFRRLGYNIVINDECKDDAHTRGGLVCKMGTEFATYYKAVEEHPGEEDRYQWFCHHDDDVYVNVPKLSHLLQQYDPHKPYYIGKWPPEHFWGKHITPNNETAYHFSHDMHLPLKHKTFRYGTGSTFCISYAIMMEAKKFFNGPRPFDHISVSATPNLHDDVLTGFIVGALLGHDLTDVVDITNQYDGYLAKSSLKDLIRYITISRDKILSIHSLGEFSSSLKSLSAVDSTKFLIYHCLLYPTVSWCTN